MVPLTTHMPYLRVKRIIDVVLVLLAAPFALLLGLGIALAIRLTTDSPVLFRQLRTGRHGERFRMLKFCTMVRNAEAMKAQLAHLNVLPAPDFKIPNDPRITKIGRFLRKTSLDELPQLINVLKGDMTLVGPRPTSFAPSTYELWHTARLEVPPGITGLWQIKGRGEITFDERLRLDIEYIRRMSFRYDAEILLRTVGSVFLREGL